MAMKIKELFLHTPIFLAGKNFRDKLRSSDLELVYDDVQERVLAKHNGIVGVIPMTTVGSMVLEDQKQFSEFFGPNPKLDTPKPTHVSHPSKLDIRNAQVEDPTTRIQNPMAPQPLVNRKIT